MSSFHYYLTTVICHSSLLPLSVKQSLATYIQAFAQLMRQNQQSEENNGNANGRNERRTSSPKTAANFPWSFFALIFKAACLLLACVTLSFSQFQKPKNKRRKRQSQPLINEFEANESPSLSPSCSSSSLACNCTTPSHCYCNTIYAVLRVLPNASPAQIRSSYRILAKQVHPDKQGPSSDASAFQRLQEAYEVLINDEKRKEYDVSEGLLGWRNERAEELQKLEKVRKLEMQRNEEQKRMEKFRKFEEDPFASAFDNFQKLNEQKQQTNNGNSTAASTAAYTAPNGAEASFEHFSPLSSSSVPQSSSEASSCPSPSRGSNSPTPAARRSVVLPLLAHFSVLALLFLVIISMPIKYLLSNLLAQRRKFVWNHHHTAQQHIHDEASAPITA